jgi:hypothetical protein
MWIYINIRYLKYRSIVRGYQLVTSVMRPRDDPGETNRPC